MEDTVPFERTVHCGLEVRRRPVGDYRTNAYVVVCVATRSSALIDPGAEPDALVALLAGTRPAAILITHSHPDHVDALAEMRRRLGVPVSGHPGPHVEGPALALDHVLTDGERLALGAHALRARFAPGHLPDQVCYQAEGWPLALVGDTVFAGGPGHTATPGAFRTTLRTLREVVLPWPDETVCYPGHGEPFTVGAVRPAIMRFLARDHGDFCGDAVWDG